VAWARAGRREAGAAGVTLAFPVQVGGRPDELRFRLASPGHPGGLSATSDPALAALLLPAMALGARLSIEGPVSPRLLAGIDRLQDVFALWAPRRFRRVPVRARPAATAPAGPGRGLACFFSGGVDSLYSAAKHAGRLQALVFVHGWDVPLGDAALRERVAGRLRVAARELGVPLVEVETNLLPFREAYVRWRWYHGAALASVALALSPAFETVVVPSSNPYSKLHPWGSHALTDPWWSTEATALVHDGAEATRLEKVACLARHPGALRALRVCFENRGGAYNCGECEKCLRTMAALRAVGALERCPAFARPLDLDAVATLGAPPPQLVSEYTDVLAWVEARGHDPALARALRAGLARAPAAARAPVAR
jgi:hypothetical protein